MQTTQAVRHYGETTPLLEPQAQQTEDKLKLVCLTGSDSINPRISPLQCNKEDLKSTPSSSSLTSLESVGEKLSCLIDTKQRALITSIVTSGATLSPLFFLSETYFGKTIAGVDFFFNAAYMRNEADDNSVNLKNMHKAMVDTTTFNMIATTLPLLLNLAPKDNPSTYALEVAAAVAVVALNHGVFMMVTGDGEAEEAAGVVDQQLDPAYASQQSDNKRDTAYVSILSTAGKIALLAHKMRTEAHSPSDECIQMTTALQGLWVLGRIVTGLEKNVRPISSSGPAMLNGLITLIISQALAVGLAALSKSQDGTADNSPEELLKILVASKIGGELVHNILKGMIYTFQNMASSDSSQHGTEGGTISSNEEIV